MTPQVESLRRSPGGPVLLQTPTREEQRVLPVSGASRDGQAGIKCQLCHVSVLKRLQDEGSSNGPCFVGCGSLEPLQGTSLKERLMHSKNSVLAFFSLPETYRWESLIML